MTCPYCGSETKVIDSRPNEDSVQRRRECRECKHRFSTVEIDLQMYDRLATASLSAIQEKVNEAMEHIKNNVGKIIFSEVLGRENQNFKDQG